MQAPHGGILTIGDIDDWPTYLVGALLLSLARAIGKKESAPRETVASREAAAGAWLPTEAQRLIYARFSNPVNKSRVTMVLITNCTSVWLTLGLLWKVGKYMIGRKR